MGLAQASGTWVRVLWSVPETLLAYHSQPCRILTALGQDTVMGANTHVEQTEPAPGVICAQRGESPEQGGNTQVLVLSGLPSISPCPKSCRTPFSGLLVSRPVYSVRKMRDPQHLPTLCHPLAPVRCDWLAVPLAGPALLEGGKRQEGPTLLFLLNSSHISGAAGAHLPDRDTEAGAAMQEEVQSEMNGAIFTFVLTFPCTRPIYCWGLRQPRAGVLTS